MAGLVARPRGSRTRRPATDLQAPQRPPAPSRRLYRGCRLPGFPTPRQSPLPATGARQMDRRQTEPDRHWSLRRRQIMARLRAWPECLPRRLLCSLQARSQDVRRARNRARRRTLPPPVPCSHQGQSPHPRRLGTRPPQRRSATRPHGKGIIYESPNLGAKPLGLRQFSLGGARCGPVPPASVSSHPACGL